MTKAIDNRGRGKKYIKAKELVLTNKAYTVDEAFTLLEKVASVTDKKEQEK